MEAKAIAKFIRISPQKTMSVANLIRGKNVREALAILRYTPAKASTAIAKVLNSAIANAEHNYACIDQGPTLKRFKPRAQGRADLMRRKTSHITVVVSQKEV